VKKITVFLLVICYLFTSVGVVANSFYCCGVLTSTTITIGDAHKADCKMAASKMRGCCKTKRQVIKVKDQHINSVAGLLLAKFFPLLHYLDSLSSVNKPNYSAKAVYRGNAPPLRLVTPVYMLNCNYRI
jgi:hypothetical protein